MKFNSTNMNKYYITVLLISWLAYLPCHGQEQTRKLHFRAAIWDPEIPSEMAYLSGGKIRPLQGLQQGIRSEAHEYSGGSKLSFYNKDVSGEDLDSPIAIVNIPKKIKNPFFLFLQNPSASGLPYKVVVVDDSLKSLPFRSYKFYSFVSDEIAVSVNQESFKLSPGADRLVTKNDDTLNIKVAIPSGKSEGWRVISDDFYPNWESERTVIFVSMSNHSGDVTMNARVFSEGESAWQRYLRKSSGSD